MLQHRVLITGASGFLGSVLVRQALEEGLLVTATDQISGAGITGVDFIAADILNPSSMSHIFKNVDCVCHVAGLAHIFNVSKLPHDIFYKINVLGTENVARAAARAGVKHFIFISSVSVYGGVALGKDEYSECHPEGPYAESKLLAEKCLIKLCENEKMDLTVLRLATLYGEGDPGNVGRMIGMMDKGRFLWIGNGGNRKSLLYKEDAARACLAVAKKHVSGINIYNVSAPSCTMREIVDGIADALGKHPLPVRIPASLALLLSRHMSRIPSRRMAELHNTVKKWLAEDVYSTRRFEEAYGFQTKTSLADGLNREVEWYKNNKRKLKDLND